MGKRKDRVKHLFKDKPANTEAKPYSKKRAATILSFASAVICILSVVGVIFLQTEFSDTDAIKTWVEENYWLSMLAMIGLCAFQVVIALIPGELLEIAAGYAFGGFIGALVCIVGLTLGSVIAILLARKFGRRLVEALYPREKIDSLPIINNPKKRNITVFLLFLIPGTPKDLLTYAVGMTEMSIPLYIALTAIARIPSIVMSTIGGGALGENKLIQALIIFIIAAIISGGGYLVYLAIQSRHKRKNQNDQNKNRS